jgi:hypothetical protein
MSSIHIQDIKSVRALPEVQKKDERKFNNIKNKISDDAFLSLQTKRR